MSYYPYLDKDYIQRVLEDYQLPRTDNWKQNLNSEVLDKYLEIKKYKKYNNDEILMEYKIFPNHYNQYHYYTDKYNLDRLKRIQNASNRKYQNNSKSQPRFNLRSSQMIYEKSTSLMKNQSDKQVQKRKFKTSKQITQNNSLKSLSETNLSPSVISKVTPFKKSQSKTKNMIESDFQLSADLYQHETPFEKNRQLSSSKKNKNMMIFTGKKNEIKSTQSFFNLDKEPYHEVQNTQQEIIIQKKLPNPSNRSSKKSIKLLQYSKNTDTTTNHNIEQKLIEYYGDQFQRIKAERDYLREKFILHLQRKHPNELPYKSLTKIQTDDEKNKLILRNYQIPYHQRNIKQKILQVSRVYKY